mgnify:FL=1
MSEHTDDMEDVSTVATGTIEGTVIDGDGTAEAGVTVGIYNEDSSFQIAETTTDSNGEYSVSVTSDQKYDVRFEKLLYEPTQKDSIAVIAGDTSTVNATMTKRSYKTRGKLDDRHSIGVFGRNTATSGESRGVMGVVDSDQEGSIGVRGVTTGGEFVTTVGVDGLATQDGIGVRGTSTGDVGVRGESNEDVAIEGVSETDHGVVGRSQNGSGSAYGVVGETDSKSGRGVVGRAGGGRFWKSSTVMGVMGFTDGSGAADGIDVGYGVRGVSRANSGLAYGISGSNQGIDGAGAHGEADTHDGVAGVLGETTTSAYDDPDATCYGVKGRTESVGPDAAGVMGEATAGSGTVHGVYGTTNSDDDTASAIYSDGQLRVSYESWSGQATIDDHAAVIEDRSGTYSAVLGLRVGDTGPTAADNFVTFYNGDDTAIGAIEADGSGGVSYSSGGADYAEYLPKADPAASLTAGEVVGVHDGTLSKQTRDADRVLVVSEQPVVTGNSPGEDTSGHETVAFTGQVPVRVRGTVEPGDVIVPSGENDGTAVAVSPAEWNPDTSIVGQAWEGDDDSGISEVTVAVGIGDEDVLASAVEELQAENAALRERVDDLESRLCDLEAATTSPASADD